MIRAARRRQTSRPHMPLRHESLRHGLLVSCCALALGLAAPPEACGQIVWDGSESSDWFVGDNWVQGFVPGSGNSVEFTNSSTDINQPIINNAEADLGTGSVLVDAGTLSIQNTGKLINRNGRLGEALGSNGTVIVTGDGSE